MTQGMKDGTIPKAIGAVGGGLTVIALVNDSIKVGGDLKNNIPPKDADIAAVASDVVAVLGFIGAAVAAGTAAPVIVGAAFTAKAQLKGSASQLNFSHHATSPTH